MVEVQPTAEQKRTLERWFRSAEQVWQWALDRQLEAAVRTGQRPKARTFVGDLPALKRERTMRWLNGAPASGLQYKLAELDTAWRMHEAGRGRRRRPRAGEGR